MPPELVLVALVVVVVVVATASTSAAAAAAAGLDMVVVVLLENMMYFAGILHFYSTIAILNPISTYKSSFFLLSP